MSRLHTKAAPTRRAMTQAQPYIITGGACRIPTRSMLHTCVPVLCSRAPRGSACSGAASWRSTTRSSRTCSNRSRRTSRSGRTSSSASTWNICRSTWLLPVSHVSFPPRLGGGWPQYSTQMSVVKARSSHGQALPLALSTAAAMAADHLRVLTRLESSVSAHVNRTSRCAPCDCARSA